MPARAPRQHMIVGQNIAFNLLMVLPARLLPIHECNLDDGDGRSLAPDISVFDTATGTPVMCIQVCNQGQLYREMKIMKKLMTQYTVQEVIVLEYVGTGLFTSKIAGWHRFMGKAGSPGYVKSETDPSFSQTLNIDLAPFVADPRKVVRQMLRK